MPNPIGSHLPESNRIQDSNLGQYQPEQQTDERSTTLEQRKRGMTEWMCISSC